MYLKNNLATYGDPGMSSEPNMVFISSGQTPSFGFILRLSEFHIVVFAIPGIHFSFHLQIQVYQIKFDIQWISYTALVNLVSFRTVDNFLHNFSPHEDIIFN